ncbi:MAG: DMT family transporter [Chloroflexi bacterium]|nr:DMT family transporter [Chloroflexota bacterium]
MLTNKPSRLVAIAEALLANLIWASSFVLVKIGLNDVGPLMLGGLRYFTAFVLLLPLMLPNVAVYRALSRRLWVRLILLGIAAYTVGNGALFWGLQYVSATTGSFEMSLTPLLVLFVGIFWLKEIPSREQFVGIAIVVVGSALFFSTGLSVDEPLGLSIVAIGILGIALSGILGREVARDRRVDTLFLTAIPLAFGGGLVFLFGLLFENAPRLTLTAVFVIVWLAVVNTALAYMLYNHSLQALTALEVNIMMNITPLATAALAWILLGERLDAIQIVGMVIVIIGVGLVQWRGRRK